MAKHGKPVKRHRKKASKKSLVAKMEHKGLRKHGRKKARVSKRKSYRGKKR